MEFMVEGQDIWVAGLRDKPGGLAEKLVALKDAGADLEFIIARRSPERPPGAGVVFVTPLRSDREVEAAADIGFSVSRSLHGIRIEGGDRPGIAADLTERLAEEGMSLCGFSASVSGRRFIVNLAVDSLHDKLRALEVLRAWGEPKVAGPARELATAACT